MKINKIWRGIIQISIMNSNLFSDLIYHAYFKIYLIKISSFKSNLRLKIKRKFEKKSLIKLKNK